jgi:hypothetical protein
LEPEVAVVGSKAAAVAVVDIGQALLVKARVGVIALNHS